MIPLPTRKKTIHRITTCSLIAGYGLLILAILLVRSQIVSGYESSIYAARSHYYWMMLISAQLIGFLSLLSSSVQNRMSRIIVAASVILLMLSSFVLLATPYLSNYFFFDRGDVLTQVGEVRDIVLTGELSQNNFYPATHILGSSIFFVTGAELRLDSLLITPIIWSAFPFFLYTLTKRFLNDTRTATIALVLGFIFLLGRYHVSFYPNALFVALLPLVILPIASVHRNKGFEWKVLSVLLVMFVVFLHPVGTSLVIIWFAIAALYLFLYDLRNRSCVNISSEKNSKRKSKDFFYASLICTTVFFLWFTSFYLYDATVHNIANWLSGKTEVTTFGHYFSLASSAGLGWIDLALLAVKRFGGILLVSLVALIGISHRTAHRALRSQCGGAGLSYLLLLFSAIAVILGFLTLSSRIPIYSRLFYFGFVCLLPIVAFFIKFFLTQVDSDGNQKIVGRRNISKSLLVPVLIIAFVLGARTVFPSEFLLSPNQHLPRTEIDGYGWLFQEKNVAFPIMHITTPSYRFSDFLYGTSWKYSRDDVPKPATSEGFVPDHFGYPFTYMGDYMNDSAYVVVSEADQIIYATVWKASGSFSTSDFLLLREDPTLQKIYENGGLKILLIQ